MYQTSDRFKRAISDHHTAAHKLEVVRGVSTTVFKVIDGQTVFDFDDTTRRSLDITFIDENNRTFQEMEDLTDAFISVLKPWRGIAFSETDVEYVPLGSYYTENLDVMEEDGVVQWRIAALDASSQAMTPLEVPYFIPAGTPLNDAVPPLISRAFPGLNFGVAKTEFTTPAVLISEESVPWEEAEKLALASGNDLYINRANVCVVGGRPATANPDAAVFHFEEGVNATFWNPQRNVRSKPPNAIVVIGTNPLAPGVRGEASDDDPYSPTFVGGRYGRKSETFRSEIVIDPVQAQAMAANILSRKLGPQDEVTFECVPNPALEESDTILVTRARLGMVRRPMLISHIECPLVPETPMRIVARRSVKSEGRLA